MSPRKELSDLIAAHLADMRESDRAEYLADAAELITNLRAEHEPDAFAASKEYQLRHES